MVSQDRWERWLTHGTGMIRPSVWEEFLEAGYMKAANLKVRRWKCCLCKGNPTISKDARNCAMHIMRKHGIRPSEYS